jgi:hypothetical protein
MWSRNGFHEMVGPSFRRPIRQTKGPCGAELAGLTRIYLSNADAIVPFFNAGRAPRFYILSADSGTSWITGATLIYFFERRCRRWQRVREPPRLFLRGLVHGVRVHLVVVRRPVRKLLRKLSLWLYIGWGFRVAGGIRGVLSVHPKPGWEPPSAPRARGRDDHGRRAGCW